MQARLVVVKNIRNQFAHAPRPINFSHPAVIEACASLVPPGDKYTAIKGRKAYVVACLALVRVLQAYGLRQEGREFSTEFP
jgi:hypothetical protein